ncbi:MAG TPA: adenylate/guanylate cyclase domain-containing protein [Alphaproteobacteria bacterium]|nr:adenylate/guanylate cyclase domain-containing protein [Alphaproteobacteria bacterium]
MPDVDTDRKLLAILCADIAGYSRMIGEDEEGTVAALKANMTERIEPAIARHHGRIVKTTGDGFLAEFASPVAAVRSAFEIQEGMKSTNCDLPESKQQWLRIGITLGDVMVREGDIFGDAVNTAARLQALAERGSIYASAAVVDQLRGHIGLGWTDLGEKTLKNIGRPVRVYRLAAGANAASTVWTNLRRRLRSSFIIGLLVVSVLAAAGTYGLWERFTSPTAPSAAFSDGTPTLAVLPLRNLSGDPQNDYISDGITEDIISALGRFSELKVMAFNATRPYKGKALRPVDVAHELGVRYLVEGSVRRAGDDLRVSASLFDAIDNKVLWSQAFDEQFQDVFAQQDAITQRVAGTLASSLHRVERERAVAKQTDSLQAYELVLRGRAMLLQVTRSTNREARQLFEQALRLDADYAAAFAGLGLAYLDVVGHGWTEFPQDMLLRAEQYARDALARNPLNVDAHVILSEVHSNQLRNDQALVEIDHALELNPSNAAAHAQRGGILLWEGRVEEAVAALESAFDLDPNSNHPGDSFILGLAYYSARRHEDAVRFLQREALRHPDYVYVQLVLAAAYAQLGRDADAARAAALVKRRLPVIDPVSFGSRFHNQADQDYLIEGLRKASLI